MKTFRALFCSSASVTCSVTEEKETSGSYLDTFFYFSFMRQFSEHLDISTLDMNDVHNIFIKEHYSDSFIQDESAERCVKRLQSLSSF